MQINIYKDQMECGSLFGKPVLFTKKDIPRKIVPDNWHCYGLREQELAMDVQDSKMEIGGMRLPRREKNAGPR